MVHYRTKQECIQGLIASQSLLATDLADGANSDAVQALGIKKTKGYKIFRNAYPVSGGFHDYTHFLQNAASDTLDERHIVASFKHPATGAMTHVTAAEFRKWVAANPPAAEEQGAAEEQVRPATVQIDSPTSPVSKELSLSSAKPLFFDAQEPMLIGLAKARFMTARNWAKTSCKMQAELVRQTMNNGPLFLTHKCHGAPEDFRAITLARSRTTVSEIDEEFVERLERDMGRLTIIDYETQLNFPEKGESDGVVELYSRLANNPELKKDERFVVTDRTKEGLNGENEYYKRLKTNTIFTGKDREKDSALQDINALQAPTLVYIVFVDAQNTSTGVQIRKDQFSHLDRRLNNRGGGDLKNYTMSVYRPDETLDTALAIFTRKNFSQMWSERGFSLRAFADPNKQKFALDKQTIESVSTAQEMACKGVILEHAQMEPEVQMLVKLGNRFKHMASGKDQTAETEQDTKLVNYVYNAVIAYMKASGEQLPHFSDAPATYKEFWNSTKRTSGEQGDKARESRATLKDYAKKLIGNELKLLTSTSRNQESKQKKQDAVKRLMEKCGNTEEILWEMAQVDKPGQKGFTFECENLQSFVAGVMLHRVMHRSDHDKWTSTMAYDNFFTKPNSGNGQMLEGYGIWNKEHCGVVFAQILELTDEDRFAAAREEEHKPVSGLRKFFTLPNEPNPTALETERNVESAVRYVVEKLHENLDLRIRSGSTEFVQTGYGIDLANVPQPLNVEQPSAIEKPPSDVEKPTLDVQKQPPAVEPLPFFAQWIDQATRKDGDGTAQEEELLNYVHALATPASGAEFDPEFKLLLEELQNLLEKPDEDPLQLESGGAPGEREEYREFLLRLKVEEIIKMLQGHSVTINNGRRKGETRQDPALPPPGGDKPPPGGDNPPPGGDKPPPGGDKPSPGEIPLQTGDGQTDPAPEKNILAREQPPPRLPPIEHPGLDENSKPLLSRLIDLLKTLPLPKSKSKEFLRDELSSLTPEKLAEVIWQRRKTFCDAVALACKTKLRNITGDPGWQNQKSPKPGKKAQLSPPKQRLRVQPKQLQEANKRKDEIEKNIDDWCLNAGSKEKLDLVEQCIEIIENINGLEINLESSPRSKSPMRTKFMDGKHLRLGQDKSPLKSEHPEIKPVGEGGDTPLPKPPDPESPDPQPANPLGPASPEVESNNPQKIIRREQLLGPTQQGEPLVLHELMIDLQLLAATALNAKLGILFLLRRPKAEHGNHKERMQKAEEFMKDLEEGHRQTIRQAAFVTQFIVGEVMPLGDMTYLRAQSEVKEVVQAVENALADGDKLLKELAGGSVTPKTEEPPLPHKPPALAIDWLREHAPPIPLSDPDVFDHFEWFLAHNFFVKHVTNYGDVLRLVKEIQDMPDITFAIFCAWALFFNFLNHLPSANASNYDSNNSKKILFRILNEFGEEKEPSPARQKESLEAILRMLQVLFLNENVATDLMKTEDSALFLFFTGTDNLRNLNTEVAEIARLSKEETITEDEQTETTHDALTGETEETFDALPLEQKKEKLEKNNLYLLALLDSISMTLQKTRTHHYGLLQLLGGEPVWQRLNNMLANRKKLIVLLPKNEQDEAAQKTQRLENLFNKVFEEVTLQEQMAKFEFRKELGDLAPVFLKELAFAKDLGSVYDKQADIFNKDMVDRFLEAGRDDEATDSRYASALGCARASFGTASLSLRQAGWSCARLQHGRWQMHSDSLAAAYNDRYKMWQVSCRNVAT